MQKSSQKTSWVGCMLTAVSGWLLCAAMCLWLTVSLEGYPEAYGYALPVALVVLFGNIFAYIFVSVRCASRLQCLLPRVVGICLGEGALLLLVYLWGKYGVAA